MSANKIWALVGALAIAGSGVYATGCSSDDSSSGNPSPTQNDASTQGDSNVTPQGDSGGNTDGGTTGDSSCTSDAANCNSCVTPAQDPLNACSPATGNCIKFDNSRVPANVPSP